MPMNLRLGLGLSGASRALFISRPAAPDDGSYTLVAKSGSPDQFYFTPITLPADGGAPILRARFQISLQSGGGFVGAYDMTGGVPPVEGVTYAVTLPAAQTSKSGKPVRIRFGYVNDLMATSFNPSSAVSIDLSPILSAISDTETGPTSASILATTTGASGTIHATFAASSPADGAAVAAAPQVPGFPLSVTSAGAKAFTATGLTAATAYDPVRLTHEVSAGVFSPVYSGDGFTTSAAPDATPPSIVNFVPVINTGTWSMSLPVQFSENILAGTGNIVLRHDNGGWADLETYNVASSPAISISGSTMTITPTVTAVAGRQYALRFSGTTVKDAANNFMAAIADDTTLAFSASVTSITVNNPPYDGFIIDSNIAAQGDAYWVREWMPLMAGRYSTAALKDPVADSITSIAGITISGYTITFGPTFDGRDMEDWDFRGYVLTWNCPGERCVFRQCEFGEGGAFIDSGSGYKFDGPQAFYLYFTQDASHIEIENNNFTGANDTRGVAFGIGASGATVGKMKAPIVSIRFNKFVGFASDCIKPRGHTGTRCEIAYNYFRLERVAAVGTATYNSATTYNIGDAVFSPTKKWLFISKTNGNVGNALPASEASSNTHWHGPDPHIDVINPKEIKNSIDIHHNYFHQTGEYEFVNLNTCMWITPDGTTDVEMGRVSVRHNYCEFAPSTNNTARSIVMNFGSSTNYAATGHVIADNVFTKSGGSNYGSIGDSRLTVRWANNRDMVTNSPISVLVAGDSAARYDYDPSASSANNGQFYLYGTTNAPNGTNILATASNVADGGSVTTISRVIGQALGGAYGGWFGDGMIRSSAGYVLTVEPEGYPAVTASTTNKVFPGLIWYMGEESNGDRGTTDPGSPYPTLPAIGFDVADKRFRWIDSYQHDVGGNLADDRNREFWLGDDDGITNVIRPMRYLAKTFSDAEPDLRVVCITDHEPGSLTREYLLDSSTDRAWANHLDMMRRALHDGTNYITKLGLHYARGNLGANSTATLAEYYAAIFFGTDLDGNSLSGITPLAAMSPAVALPNGEGSVNHIWPEANPFYLDYTRLLLNADDCIAANLTSFSASPVVQMGQRLLFMRKFPDRATMAVRHSIAKRGEVGDYTHIDNNSTDGFCRNYQTKAVCVARQSGLVFPKVPKFDEIQWSSDGMWLRLGWSGGSITTWELQDNGQTSTAAFRSGAGGQQQVVGFFRETLTPPTRTEIRTPNGDGSPGALAAFGDVYVYPNSGTFSSTSKVYWYLDSGVYESSLVSPETGYGAGEDGVYRYLPIAYGDTSAITDFRGIMVQPDQLNPEYINDENDLSALFGVDYYTAIPATALSTGYSFDNPTSPSTDTVTIDVVIESATGTDSTRPATISSTASGGAIRVTGAGAVVFEMSTNTASTWIFRCQTVDGVVPDGTAVKIRVTAKRINSTTGDVHCYVDTGSGLVLQDGGTPAANSAFGSAIAWAQSGVFAHDNTNRMFHIGQSSQADSGKLGSLAVFAGVEYADTSDHDPFTASLYVRADAAETGFEKWNGTAWAAI